MATNIQLPLQNIKASIGAEKKFLIVPLQRKMNKAASNTANPTCTNASENMIEWIFFGAAP